MLLITLSCKSTNDSVGSCAPLCACLPWARGESVELVVLLDVDVACDRCHAAFEVDVPSVGGLLGDCGPIIELDDECDGKVAKIISYADGARSARDASI